MDGTPSLTHCVMPHIGLAMQNHADFCCCNVNKQSWQDTKLQTMHVYSHALQDTWKSHTRKTIAAVLDHGQRHKSCQVCWDLEDAGANSPRIQFNKKFGHLTPLPNQPRILVLKPGNTCNFACRMCNPMTSSSWYADGHVLEKHNLHSTSWYQDHGHENTTRSMTFNEYSKSFEHIRHSYNSDNLGFWTSLRDWLPNLDFVDIYGGEPFLTPALFDWLEHGVEQNVSKKISLDLHTNASVFNRRYAEILCGYQHVNFRLSLDSDDPMQLEYIRHKANWHSIIENIHKFRGFFSAHENVDLGIAVTLSPLNVFEIDRILENLSSMLGLPTYLNIVTTPEYDIRHIPLPLKHLLMSKIQNQKVVRFLEQTIPGCESEWPKFCRATDLLDRLRDQRFSAVFPDWWKELEKHWISA